MTTTITKKPTTPTTTFTKKPTTPTTTFTKKPTTPTTTFTEIPTTPTTTVTKKPTTPTTTVTEIPTTPTTTVTKKPTTPTTTEVTTPSTPSTPVDDCGCTYDKIWLDVILVIDSSSAMTKYGLDTLLNYILSAVSKMSIGQQLKQVSRIGVVMYDNTAWIEFNLTVFQKVEDVLDNLQPKYTGRFGSNIEAGIRLANAEFEGPGHRPNAKKVIIIAASHFEPETSTDPIQIAETFKGNGGVIITLEYVQTHGMEVPILKELATSSCYQLTNRYGNLKVNDLLDSMCKANCFCKTQWFSYLNDAQCLTPQRGCLFPVSISSNQFLAERYCEHEMNATTPKIIDLDEATSLVSLTPYRQSIWTGLHWKDQKFVWSDGSSLGNYQPIKLFDKTKECFYQKYISQSEVGWFSADCFLEDFVYACQAKACSTDNYCAENDNNLS